MIVARLIGERASGDHNYCRTSGRSGDRRAVALSRAGGGEDQPRAGGVSSAGSRSPLRPRIRRGGGAGGTGEPRRGRRLLLTAALFGFAFTAVYVVAGHNNQLLGIALGGMFALLAAAAIIAGKVVVPQETSVEEREPTARGGRRRRSSR